MDEVVVWSYVVLLLAVLPWLVYIVVLLFFLLSILYGSVFSLCHSSIPTDILPILSLAHCTVCCQSAKRGVYKTCREVVFCCRVRVYCDKIKKVVLVYSDLLVE